MEGGRRGGGGVLVFCSPYCSHLTIDRGYYGFLAFILYRAFVHLQDGDFGGGRGKEEWRLYVVLLCVNWWSFFFCAGSERNHCRVLPYTRYHTAVDRFRSVHSQTSAGGSACCLLFGGRLDALTAACCCRHHASPVGLCRPCCRFLVVPAVYRYETAGIKIVEQQQQQKLMGCAVPFVRTPS